MECLEERIRQLESHDTGALLRRYDQQLQQTRAGFHTERARLQATIRDLQRELAEVRNEAAERGVEQPGGLDEGGVNAGISNGICGARFGEIGFGANEVRAGTEGSDGGGMAPKIASQDAKREAAEAKERAQELEKRINELHRETAMLRERLDEAKKAEFRRGELEEEAARLRERCADLERGLENERSAYSHRVERLEQERSAYSHQVERLEKERAAHAHQVEWLEKERRAHSHQTEQLTHQVWALQKELPAVEAKADGSAGCENAQQGKDAGKNEAAQKTEDRKPREGFGSAPAHLLPGGTERLGWEAPEAANLAESGDRHLQDWKDGTALERMELDNAALRTGGLRFGGIDRAMWSGEQESDRSMLLGAAQEEIEKLQEVTSPSLYFPTPLRPLILS